MAELPLYDFGFMFHIGGLVSDINIEMGGSTETGIQYVFCRFQFSIIWRFLFFLV